MAPSNKSPTKRIRGKKPEKVEPSEPEHIGDFGCVVRMWNFLNNLPTPCTMDIDSTLYIFEKGTAPLWEDPNNVNGGRWMFTIQVNMEKIDDLWQHLVLMFSGGSLDSEGEITGILVSVRRNYIRISIWTKNRDNTTYLMALGTRIKAMIPDDIRLEYQDHGAPFNEYRHLI